ncbi:MAG: magnesium transporter [Chloroflexota bacterium]|nr:magnesium transporter [Chloroflexota bacterium]
MTLRAILYDAKGADREVDLASGERLRFDRDRLLWIDIDERNAADLGSAAQAVGLEPEGLLRLSRVDRQARILRLPERVVLTLGAVEPDDVDAARHEFDIVVGANHVITVHDGPLGALDTFRAEIGNEDQLGRLDAAGFTAGLIDALFSAFFKQIESIERDIDALDEVAIRADADTAFLGQVLVLRRRIARLRRVLAPNREALLPLERPDFELRSNLGPVWPGIVERLERAIDGLENARELLVGSFDLYLGRASQRTNDVMKALTLLSAIALPGVVVAGVMGMNFKAGFFDDPNNFYVVIGAMIVFSLAILGVARWRRWV